MAAMARLGRIGGNLSFSDALRQAVGERGLSLARLSSRLEERGVHVGVSTLSTWQSGRRVPSDASAEVLAALEELLQLPAGWLRGRVGRARVEALRPRTPYRVAENAAALTRLIGELGTDAHGALRTTSVIEELTLGDDGALQHKLVVHTLKAVRPVDRLLIVHRSESGPGVEDLVPEALTGCRVGRVVRDRVDGSMLAELLLDQRLDIDESVLVRYAVHDRGGARAYQYFRIHEWMGAHHALEVVFAPTALPVRITEFQRARGDGAETGERELRLRGHRALALVPQTTPGIVGLRWEWD